MRRLAPLLAVLLAGCAASPPPPAEVPYARAMLERYSAPALESPVETPPLPPSPPPARSFDETAGLLRAPPERLIELGPPAATVEALDAFLAKPVARDDLAALAFLRSPVLRAARAALEAARTEYRQAADLRDLVALYRSFAEATGRPPTERIPPHPAIGALSGEVTARTVAMAEEDLRGAVRDTVAAAERVHADAARLSAVRRIREEDLQLAESLLEVLRARYESGQATQAGYLAFAARLAGLRTDLEDLVRSEATVRARLNALLDRAEDAPVRLDLTAADPGALPTPEQEAKVLARALRSRPEHRKAVLAAERAAFAVRLAETMTLPRMDLEAGGRVMPRADFGVKEAQVAEMRARRASHEAKRDASAASVRAEVRAALVALDAAARRVRVQREEIVPLAERAFAAARGAYEGNRSGYLDLLDAARGFLRARLGLADSKRTLAHARANLLRAVGAYAIEERLK